jgi:hypothetical protein
MEKRTFLKVLLAALAVIALATASWADTLELKDGKLIQGKFLGGSEFNIRFQVNGQEQIFKKADVLNISFNDTVAGSTDSSQASAPAPAAAAAPASVAAAAPATAPEAVAPSTAAMPASNTVTIPSGTHLLIRMIDGIDSSKNKVGDRFHASLEDNLVVNDVVVAPKGADVYGRLSEAKSAGSISGKSQLRLELTGISINGQIQTISTSDYEVSGKSRGTQSAERIGGGAAIGAIIGAIAGGGKGAAIGAGVGAGAGTGIQVLTKGEQVRVPSETLLDFTLDQPVTVTVSAKQ